MFERAVGSELAAAFDRCGRAKHEVFAELAAVSQVQSREHEAGRPAPATEADSSAGDELHVERKQHAHRPLLG